MPRRLSFLAVEGQHDAAFIGRLLKDAGFRLVQRKDQDPQHPHSLFLEPVLERLVPPSFPHDNDLLARVPVPFFWQNDSHAIALRPANSDSKLINSTVSAIRSIGPGQFGAVGIVLDADTKGVPTTRMESLKAKQATEVARMETVAGFVLPNAPGIIAAGPPKCGVFVMPDNLSAGTLEDLLLDCAQENYPDLKQRASEYLAAIDRTVITASDLNEIGAPAGEKKAYVGLIASVLRPGKAIQNSISDNRWLEGTARTQPRIETLRKFLRDLLNEPTI